MILQDSSVSPIQVEKRNAIWQLNRTIREKGALLCNGVFLLIRHHLKLEGRC